MQMNNTGLGAAAILLLLAAAAQAQTAPRIEAAWDRIDVHLAGRRFMAGDQLTTVDLQLTMLTRWSRNMPRPATAWPNIAAYLKAMRARPALQEVHAREGVTDWIND